MTQDLVRVFHVSQQVTRTGLVLYIVTTTKVARPDVGLQLETVNPYAASICMRARELGRSVVVEWERTRYGRTLMAAHFLKVDAA